MFDATLLALMIDGALHRQNSSLVVLTVSPVYAGLSLSTNQVASDADARIVTEAIRKRFGPTNAPNVSVGLPT